MRTLTDHKVNGLNEAIQIHVMDAPGPGGANHTYGLSLFPGLMMNGMEPPNSEVPPNKALIIEFQNGPIASAADANGFTNEALLAVLIDRMRGFQYARDPDGNFSKAPGQFSCRENAIALTHLEDALMWLQKRTRDRMARGVEGTMKQ